ncbi:MULTISPECIES: hypothetical protein [Pseudomonas]|uniref:Uncharacterized protein n=1 Tax=Pseudomonas vlassakiae TaxID=485888 RepID=A0A923GKF9_9PSED|nr:MULTISPECIES: hypothetical protein [Pseudomonas]MBH3414538.1 hypothetical protein [Pseudomonas putida]MBV4542853.1 hypothetical protein [Pseudomonas vlassakiae]
MMLLENQHYCVYPADNESNEKILYKFDMEQSGSPANSALKIFQAYSCLSSRGSTGLAASAGFIKPAETVLACSSGPKATTAAGELAGVPPKNPLLDDSIPRNGDRLVVNQGPVPLQTQLLRYGFGYVG